MNHLIDRYVWAVSERLPDEMRDDVADELRGTIADMAEARGGVDDSTIRDVLLELGEPAELASRYGGRPRHLIGPRYYADYVNVLKAVAVAVLPLVLLANLVVDFWDPGQAVVPGILGAVGGTVEVAMHIFVWTTLTFLVVERTGVEPAELRGGRREWDPDSLPKPPAARQITRGDLVVGVALLLAPVVLVLWQRFRPVVTDADGNAIPVLHPDLWSLWIPLFFALVAVNIAVEVWKFRERVWTLRVTLANAVVNLAWIVLVTTMVLGVELINPQFTEALGEAGRSWNPTIPGVVAIMVVVVIGLWDTVDSLAKHRKVRTGMVAQPARSASPA